MEPQEKAKLSEILGQIQSAITGILGGAHQGSVLILRKVEADLKSLLKKS